MQDGSLTLDPVALHCFQQAAVAQAQGRLPAAAADYEEALRLQPGFAVAAMNLGNVLAAMGQLDAAVLRYRLALQLRPEFAEACMNLANVLVAQGHVDEAMTQYRRALTLRPGYADARVNLGNLLQGLGRFAEAESEYRCALALRAGHPETLVNLASVLEVQQRRECDDEAIACYDAALAARPDYAEAHVNRAMHFLRMGEFATGWPGYEWRTKMPGYSSPRRSFPQPQWRGEPMAVEPQNGARILLHGEQGLGDCLQFLRYVPLVQKRVQAAGGSLLLEVPGRLVRFARRLGVPVFAHGEHLPAFDWHCPLMSLPHVFATTVATIPASPLAAPPAARAGGLRVGVAWAGNARHPRDWQRSIPFEVFARLFAIQQVEFFSLQLGLACLPDSLTDRMPANVVDLAPVTTDIEDTARQMEQLDLVIAVDTAVAHLAGMLGKPVWILLAQHADWRWLRGREDSPWYPTARLFRQTRFQDWPGVIERVRLEFERWRDA